MHNIQINQTFLAYKTSVTKQRSYNFAKLAGYGLCFFLATLTLNPAQAAGVVGNGTAASCTEAAFTSALTGGGTVTFNCGAAPKIIVFSREKVIAKDTIINGKNLITLSGDTTTRLFNVNAGVNFTVNNLTLANGSTTDEGAAINADAFENTTITVNNCKFLNNESTKMGEVGGGAINSAHGFVFVDKSTFEGNKAATGGAIRILQSDLTVTNSTFSFNKAVEPFLGDGGAIHIDGTKTDIGKIIIRTSKFTNNSASNYGGAVFNNILNAESTAITDSEFTDNFVGGGLSSGQGGAIWTTGDPKLGGQYKLNANQTTFTIVNSSILRNTSTKHGGGIFLARHIKDAGAIISRCTIANNMAKFMGGGIAQDQNGKLTIMNSTISGNKALGPTSMGGGAHINRKAKATIAYTTIVNNVADFQAGGVFGLLNVNMNNSILANNLAENGGKPWNIKHNCFEPFVGTNNIQFPKPIDAVCTPGIIIADPQLEVLKKNGGLTQTHALSVTSPANRQGLNCLPTDQRDVARPSPVGTRCDIGAFEAPF